MRVFFIVVGVAFTVATVLCATEPEKTSFCSNSWNSSAICPKKFILLRDVMAHDGCRPPSMTLARDGGAAESIWNNCNLKNEKCVVPRNVQMMVDYTCEYLEDIKEIDICRNVSGIMETPFYLHSPRYPGSFGFKKGQTCNCRLYTLSLRPFDLTVQHFMTSLKDGLRLTWEDKTKYIVSEEEQNIYDVTTGIVDATLKFAPTQQTTGSFWIKVDTKNRTVRENMMLQCQDRPFKPAPTAEEQRNRLIINNVAPIAAMAAVGIIALISLLISECLGTSAKAKARKRGAPATVYAAPPSGKPGEENINYHSSQTHL